MKKVLLVRFMLVLVLALLMSGAISYYFLANQLLDNNIDNLTKTIHVVDYALDYSKDIEPQLEQLHQVSFDETTRVTIVNRQGVVFADSKTEDVASLENHLQREEIEQALKKGFGYATRYSQTIQRNMLYVAGMSTNGEYIIRISVPYTSIFDYLKTVFPMLLAGITIAFIISVIITISFTNSITMPLQHMSKKMKKIHGSDLKYEKQKYQYEELNIISDTTAKLTEDIKEYVDKLEFEKKIRQEFFSNASHELKTPITSIKGYAELLDAGFVQDEVTKKDFMRRILKETDNMTTLIDDILMISRLETKEAEVTFSQVRMAPLVKEIFCSLEPMAMEYQITMHSECEPITIEASAKQMRELIMNLVSNSVKYNHPGGNVWVKVSQKGGNIIIEVKDDGMGMAPKDQGRVFERFYRVDKGRSKKMGGTGLGLSIVKHIVEFYEGSVSLKSSLGKGSKFIVNLPIERASKRQNLEEV